MLKQPRVPELREGEDADQYLRKLALFLKDFSMDVWTSEKNKSMGMYAFHIDERGHLICTYDTAETPPLVIDGNGHLIYRIGG